MKAVVLSSGAVEHHWLTNMVKMLQTLHTHVREPWNSIVMTQSIWQVNGRMMRAACKLRYSLR